MEPRGLLAVWMEVRQDMPEAEQDLHHWYAVSHLPERLAVPGFLNGRRYVSVAGGPKYSALYDLKDLDVLQSEAYRALRDSPDRDWTRRIGQSLAQNIRREYSLIGCSGRPSPETAPAVLMTRYDLDAGADDARGDAEAYRTALMSVPGVLSISHFESHTEGAPKYMAVHELARIDVPSTADWIEKLKELASHRHSGPTNVETNLGLLITGQAGTL